MHFFKECYAFNHPCIEGVFFAIIEKFIIENSWKRRGEAFAKQWRQCKHLAGRQAGLAQ